MSAHASAKSELVIVSNRLPVQRVVKNRKPSWEKSPGGLVSAMEPILRDRASTWIGWAGVSGKAFKPFTYDGIDIRPVTLQAKELRSFYDGFCNRTLWPLYHDSVRSPEYRRRWWWPYIEVNQRFADAVVQTAGKDAIVWVHDYQLQLVPNMLRQMRPDLKIGFFLHIPFPPIELFARLPWREQILEGMLGADVIGFQTKHGARNFVDLSHRFTSARGGPEQLQLDGRRVFVDAFPISIDADLFARTAEKPAVRRQARDFRERLGKDRRILLGVDRLDYTKGIEVRLKAFRELLQDQRLRPDECAFVQVAVPSRERVEEYQELREQIERLVGELNGAFGQLGHAPMQYLHRSLPLEELVALYVAADVMIVTPHRDGMNLVAKEYVMSRPEQDGVLILSEFTGSAAELQSALLVNPHDVDGLTSTIEAALQMPLDEQRQRIVAMQRHVREHDVFAWAQKFFDALKQISTPIRQPRRHERLAVKS